MTEATVVIMLCDIYLSWVVRVGPKVGHAGTSSDMWVLPKGQHLEKTTAKSPGTSLCSDLHLDPMALGPQQLSSSRPALLCFIQEPQVQKGFPGGASGKEPACQCRRHKRCRFDPLGWEGPLEEGMVSHSSIFAWEIPWIEEPGTEGYSPWGHRVGHDGATNTHADTHTHLLNRP